MNFDASDLHIDVPLTNMVVGYEPKGFIAEQILPIVPSGKQSNKFYKWDKEDFFRIENAERSPSTIGREVQFGVSSDSFFCENYAYVQKESYESMANADAVLASREKRIRGLKNKLLLHAEDRMASAVTSTSNVGSSTTLSGVNQWTDKINSDPINDIEVGKESVRSTTGYDVNTMVLGKKSFDALRYHPDIIEKIKYTQKGIVTTDLLIELFGIEKILIGTAIKNTADPRQSGVFTDIWGDSCFMCHTNPTPDPDGKDPSYGYKFQWTDSLLGAPYGAEVWRNAEIMTEYRRVQTYEIEKIVATDLAYLLLDTTNK